MIAAVIYNGEPLEVEQRLHGKVVLALADEDLSEVRVQLDGRKVFLYGPEELLPAALAVTNGLSGVHSIETQVVPLVNSELGFRSAQIDSEAFVQVIHPDTLYWPVKNEGSVYLESGLLVTKVHRNVEVNGIVPNVEIERGVLGIFEKLIEMPEHLYDVTINNIKEIPTWYLQGLPLIIPFVQWVEEGQLQYQGNKILLDGFVLNEKARNAIETAITNIPAQFLIENRLKTGKE